jgi:hypothetical protein
LINRKAQQEVGDIGEVLREEKQCQQEGHVQDVTAKEPSRVLHVTAPAKNQSQIFAVKNAVELASGSAMFAVAWAK